MVIQSKFFLTHSWKDIEFARRLGNDLRANGLEGFLDDHSIGPGDNIAARINKGLAECDIYLPILSYTALESPWCEEEITTAIYLSKIKERRGRPRIIPLLLENCQDKIEASMPTLLARLYISFTDQYEHALQELLSRGFGLSGLPRKPLAKMENKNGGHNQSKQEINNPFLMPIDDVFDIREGIVVTGRIKSGTIKAGERVEITGKKGTYFATVTSVEQFHRKVDIGQSGDNIGCVLQGIQRGDVERGMLLVAPGSINP